LLTRLAMTVAAGIGNIEIQLKKHIITLSAKAEKSSQEKII
jgi:hypothetical protein